MVKKDIQSDQPVDSCKESTDSWIQEPVIQQAVQNAGCFDKTLDLARIYKEIEMMESMYQHCLEAAMQLQSAVHQLKGSLTELSILKSWLNSGGWMRAFELDEQGLFPASLRRGVLSEDGLDELFSQLLDCAQEAENCISAVENLIQNDQTKSNQQTFEKNKESKAAE